MELLEAIKTRRTIGKSTGELSREAIAELLEAAVWAPNHKMTQPWRFSVLSGDARAQLGQIWAKAAGSNVALEQRETYMAGEAKKLLRAPHVIVVSVRTDENPIMAEEDLTATAAAVQNLLLAAHAKGYAAAWKSGKICYSGEVKRFLGLDPADRIIALVYLGAVGTEEPQLKPRDITGAISWIGEAVPA